MESKKTLLTFEKIARIPKSALAIQSAIAQILKSPLLTQFTNSQNSACYPICLGRRLECWLLRCFAHTNSQKSAPYSIYLVKLLTNTRLECWFVRCFCTHKSWKVCPLLNLKLHSRLLFVRDKQKGQTKTCEIFCKHNFFVLFVPYSSWNCTLDFCLSGTNTRLECDFWDILQAQILESLPATHCKRL